MESGSVTFTRAKSGPTRLARHPRRGRVRPAQDVSLVLPLFLRFQKTVSLAWTRRADSAPRVNIISRSRLRPKPRSRRPLSASARQTAWRRRRP